MSKFPDARTEALYVLSLDGWFTESDGDVVAPCGWFAWTDIAPSDVAEIAEAFEEEFHQLADIDGVEFDPMSLVGGWMLYEDEQGFVSAVEYDRAPHQQLGVQPAAIAFRTLSAEFDAWSVQS
jgi:hypothetical protein